MARSGLDKLDKDIDGACVEQIVDSMVGVVRLIAKVLEGVPRCNADLVVKRHVLGRWRHGAVDMVDRIAHALTVRTACSLLGLEGHDRIVRLIRIPFEVDGSTPSFAA